jgi:hypothetical protein
MTSPTLQRVPQRVFVRKHGEIPLLLDYSGVAPAGWWQHWPCLTWEQGRLLRSSINPWKLLAWARRADHPDMGTVLEISRDLKHGCDLGTRGEYLCPSTSSNAPSAFEYGDRVTDYIVDGIKIGIVMGPMRKMEIPFESVKVNELMVKLKDNGVARNCMNMSRGDPFCANNGMFNDERFEVTKSTTKEWLVSLHSAGRGCWFCKIDWSGTRDEYLLVIEGN